MPISRSKLKMIAVIVGAIIFLSFGATLDKGPTPAERAFSTWIGSLSGNTSDKKERFRAVKVQALLTRPALNLSLSLEQGGSPEQLLRLLEILRETDLKEIVVVKDLTQPLPTPDDDEGVIVAQNEKERFYLRVPDRQLRESIALQNFVRLLELMSQKQAA